METATNNRSRNAAEAWPSAVQNCVQSCGILALNVGCDHSHCPRRNLARGTPSSSLQESCGTLTVGKALGFAPGEESRLRKRNRGCVEEKRRRETPAFDGSSSVAIEVRVQTLIDADGPDTVRMSVAEARALGERALTRLGFDTDVARIVTDQLVDNALCGYRFAGLPRILAIAADQKSKATRRPIAIVRETPVSALVDGGNNLGYVAAYRGAEIAVAKAKASGISVVGVYDSYYSGRNAYYVEIITRAGLIGIHTASAAPHVLPPGGTRPALGTNPLSIGFPSKGNPVIYDIGTASMMWGEVLLHAHLGLPIPEGIGFDATGQPSTNAAEVAKGGIAPFGGYKGYGLSFAIQALGLLGGAALAHGNVQDYAFVFIAIDPTIMLDQGAFETGMTQLVERIKATPRASGVSEIRVPSERAFRERARRLLEGIVIDRKVVQSLQAF